MEDNYPLTAIMSEALKDPLITCLFEALNDLLKANTHEALKDSLTANTPEALKDSLTATAATATEELEDISPELFEGFAHGYISHVIIDDYDTITDIEQYETCIILTTYHKKILFYKYHDSSYRFYSIYHINDIINKNINRDETPCYVNVVILEKIENNILYFLHVDLDYEVETRVMVPYNS